MQTPLFIGGEVVPAADGARLDDLNPGDGDVIAAVALVIAGRVSRP